jgi:hypothetical protein
MAVFNTSQRAGFIDFLGSLQTGDAVPGNSRIPKPSKYLAKNVRWSNDQRLIDTVGCYGAGLNWVAHLATRRSRGNKLVGEPLLQMDTVSRKRRDANYAI